MKMIRLTTPDVLFWFLSCAILGRYSAMGQTTATGVTTGGTQEELTRRAFITVEYDYKLETNTSSTSSDQDPLESVLLDIDSDIIATMQENLPNGDIPEGKVIPDVQFNTINSRFINMCFTESDSCKWVKSRIRLSYAGDRPISSMERLTFGLVQEYLEEINDSNPFVNTMYVYPMIYSTVGKFQISPVEGSMSDTDIEDFEDKFYEVFHALVFEVDGDTDLTEAYFVYQDVRELPDQEQETDTAYSMSVDMKYYGKCRYCDEAEFVETVDGLIEGNVGVFLQHLKKTLNTTYFQQAENISFSVPELSDELPPIENEYIFDLKAPEASTYIPLVLWLGVIMAVAVITTGVLVIVRDQQQLNKEEVSTGDESSVFEEKNHENEDDEIMCTGSIAENSIVSKSDTVNSNGMHSNYEVYVY